MWFLNKETSMKWEVYDQDLIKRLEQSEHYDKVEEPTRTEESLITQDANYSKRPKKEPSS